MQLIVKLGAVSVAELHSTLLAYLEEFLHDSSPSLAGLPSHEVGVYTLMEGFILKRNGGKFTPEN